MPHTGSDYRKILQSELQSRKQKNPRYSLRAFARSLEIDPTRLSRILNYKEGLSRDRARRVALSLFNSEDERVHFCDLVLQSDGRSKAARENAANRIKKQILDDQTFRVLAAEEFTQIHQWEHYAIRELVETHNFEPNPAWIANRLGISEERASTALSRLIELGILKKINDGSVENTYNDVTTTDNIPLPALREFHKQTLQKAVEAIEMQSIEQRSFSSLTFAFSKKHIGELKEMISEFRREVNQWAEGTLEPRDSVYVLGLQLFEATRSNEE